MSLKLFTHYLAPIGKTGAVGLVEKRSASKPKGDIIQGAFSRADAGATSGANVFNSSGELVELVEDYPDWSFDADGQNPKLLLRALAENTLHTFAEAGITYLGDTTNPYGVTLRRYSTDGGSQAQVRFGSGQLGTLTNGTRYLIKWFVQIINPTGADRFRVEMLGTTVGVGVTSWEFNGTLNPSGDASDMEMIDLGGGHYELRVYLTPSSGDETPTALDFQVQNGSSDPDPGGEFAFGGFMLIEKGAPDDYIFTDGIELTRSANSVEFTDLFNKGVLSANAGTFLINPKTFLSDPSLTGAYLAGLYANKGSDFLGLATQSSDRMRPAYVVGSVFLTQNTLNAPRALIYTWDANGVRIYDNTGLVASDSTTLPSTFVDFNLSALSGVNYSLGKAGLSFAPIAFTEAEALAAITEAENL